MADRDAGLPNAEQAAEQRGTLAQGVGGSEPATAQSRHISPRERSQALIVAAMRRRPARGFIVLDLGQWTTTAILAAFVSLMAFAVCGDERLADRRHAEMTAIAEECLVGWEQTIDDLNVCADVREDYEAGDRPCTGTIYGAACRCWLPPLH